MINDKFNNASLNDGFYDNPNDEESFKTYFHPAFCAAMRLELREDRNHLIFDDEFVLNKKPNSIDFLTINMDESIKVKSGLGAIFKKHNLFEFKNYRDSLNERVYHRTMGYVHLYIAYNEKEVSLDDVTVSFLREAYPRKLMEYFNDNDFKISVYENGIYHIKKKGHIDVQIIVTRRLGETYAWINKLTRSLRREDVLRMQKEKSSLDDQIDHIYAESVIDLSITLNRDKDFIKEMIGMGLLRDMFQDEFEEKDKKIRDLSEQLQTEQEENAKLRRELEEFKKLVGNKIAML